jgi:hydroxymethylpyrimidine/phosphomethylpyrimidine kinase
MKEILLSIAGFDPTSGAGIPIDLKVFDHLGFRGMGILTSVTAQNTKSVKKVICLSSEFLLEQYTTLKDDFSFAGIKIGMTGCSHNISVIEKILSENLNIPRILDTVFKSSSGTWLLEEKAVPDFMKKLAGKATLITPNLSEASSITGIPICQTEDMKTAAKKIYDLYGIPTFIKGGHLKESADNLLYDGTRFTLFKNERIHKNVHGTGCFLSSSILCLLAKGYPLEKSCYKATQLTYNAVKNAAPYGSGQELISLDD